jgi:hypothetical protein
LNCSYPARKSWPGRKSAEDYQGSPTVNINGHHFSRVSYELDGAANQDPILGQIVSPQPFANNFIPAQYLSPQALALLKLIPLPNGPGLTSMF